jgi:hypothetical protein
VRRLLGDDDALLRDRAAGCLVLIYAQPLTRIPALLVDDVIVDGDRVWIQLGREPVELPDPLAQLGIRTLGGRTAAIQTLAAPLPPTILAEMLGISETSASKWHPLAGGEWNRFPAEAARRRRQAHDRRPDVTDPGLR